MKQANRVSPRKLKATARRAEAVKLRLAGRTFEEIGEHMGVTRQAAYSLVNRTSIELDATAKAARIESHERQIGDARKTLELCLKDLNEMRDNWRAAANRPNEYPEDSDCSGPYLRAIDHAMAATGKMISLMEREAKLYGLDAPTKVEHSVLDDHAELIIQSLHECLMEIFLDRPQDCNRFWAAFRAKVGAKPNGIGTDEEGFDDETEG